MYHIHTSLGFVLSSKPYREADRVYQIFTKEFGLISAIAQGIRFEKSKLRYSINDLQVSNFSLVHGKEFWRIVGAEAVNQPQNSKRIIVILSKLSILLKRLIHGEEQNEIIFNILAEIANLDINDPSLAENIESLSVLQILHQLGYIAKTKDNEDFFAGKVQDLAIDIDVTKRKIINQAINSALKNSQL